MHLKHSGTLALGAQGTQALACLGTRGILFSRLSIKALSQICPQISTTAMPVISCIFSSFFFAAIAVVALFVCLFVCFFFFYSSF